MIEVEKQGARRAPQACGQLHEIGECVCVFMCFMVDRSGKEGLNSLVYRGKYDIGGLRCHLKFHCHYLMLQIGLERHVHS